MNVESQPSKGGGDLGWWHTVFPNTTCNATLCQTDPANPSNKCCTATPPAESCQGNKILRGRAALSLGRGSDLCPTGARCGPAAAQCQYASSDCSLPPTPEQCCQACQATNKCGSWFLNGDAKRCLLKLPGATNDTVTPPSANFSAGSPCAAPTGYSGHHDGGGGSCGNGGLTNTTDFDTMYARDATPYQDAQGRHLYGFTTMPQTRKEAYEVLKGYYNARVAWITSIGDTPYAPLAKVNSITCVRLSFGDRSFSAYSNSSLKNV